MSPSITGRRQSIKDDGLPPSKRIRPTGHDEDIGHPIEDDDTAKRKLREAGFDPNQISKRVRGTKLRDFVGEAMKVTPMIYFSSMGDLPMCRYLYNRGAKGDVTRACSHRFWFPMYAAAEAGHLAVCQWLHDRGTENDIYKRCGANFCGCGGAAWSPLKAALCDGHFNVCKWLILNGASHPGGTFNHTLATMDFVKDVKIHNMEMNVLSLKSWALNTVACHATFRVFLLGTLSLRSDDCSAALQSILSRNLRSDKAARLLIEKAAPEDHIVLLHELSSPLHVLGGFPEILELVADFVGIVKRSRDRERLHDLAKFFSMLPPRESDEAKREGSVNSRFEAEDDVEDVSSTDEEGSDASSDGTL